MSNVLSAIREKQEDCYRAAEEYYGRKFPRSPICFDLTGGTAGQFCYKGKQTKIRYNKKIAAAQPDAFLARTVGHEVAHAIQHWLYTAQGIEVQSHGKEWKFIMVRVMKQEPSRCHKYDITDAVRNTRPYLYVCSACDKAWHFGPKKHANMKACPGRYRCRCGGTINYTIKQNKKDFVAELKKPKLLEMNLDNL